jgi:ABC-type transport system involved in multi-copper enzyme maturation permease subunit
MSTVLSTQQDFPEPKRAASVELGSQKPISVIWRLTCMEIYKLRRRTYSRVVLLILLGLVMLLTAFLGFTALSQANAPASSLIPPRCSANTTSQCTTRTYNQAQLEQNKVDTMHGNAMVLGLPGSFEAITQILSVAVIAPLGIALLGLITGVEYSTGIVRLLFTRGPTRLQCMLAKIIASLIYTAAVVCLLIIAYIAVGMLAYPLAGEPYSYIFGLFHTANFGTVIGNSMLLGLIAIGAWFTYGMLALFFGTLGRSTAAAAGSAFGWFILEMLVIKALGAVQALVLTGPIHALAKAVPDYLLFTNLTTLSQNRIHAISPSMMLPSSLSDSHALIVVGVYLVLLIGGACLIATRQQVTS